MSQTDRLTTGRPFVFSVVFIVFFAGCARAQVGSSGTDALSLGGSYYYGSFIANDPRLQYVQDGRTVLGEISIASQTSGKKEWQRASGNPEIGLAFLYGRSGSSQYIGSLSSLVPFINFHLYRTGIFALNFRLGAGATWVQKVFNPETDYKNLVISTHLNACINLVLASRIQLLPRTSLDLGVSFTHISNGGIKVPNLGLNIPSLAAGIRYSLTRPGGPPAKPSDAYPAKLSDTARATANTVTALPATALAAAAITDKKIHYYVYAFVAGKESYPIESAVYLVNVFSLEALKNFSPTGRVGAGINFTYDRAQTTEVLTRTVYSFSSSKSLWQASVYGVYEYVTGNLSFPLQIGYYLYNNYKINTIWQNIGIKYRFSAHWTAGIGLKAHLGNGDFIQGGLGYRF